MQFRLNSQTKKMCSTNRESSSQITSLIWARARILADSRRHYARGTLAPFPNASFVLEDPVDSRLSREREVTFSAPFPPQPTMDRVLFPGFTAWGYSYVGDNISIHKTNHSSRSS